jgi:DNA-binding NarL/FixJ family response regulator
MRSLNTLPREAVSQQVKLTPREWEVAWLIASGCTNRKIGETLRISERTVDTHVSHLLRKLQVASRAQIAVWAVLHRPRFKLLS